MEKVALPIVCDGLRLAGNAYVPSSPRGVAVLLHGIPSVAPRDPDDRGYEGLAERFAEDRWVAVWAGMRGVAPSAGFFSIEGWVRDVKAIVTAARSLSPGMRLGLVGSSAGGAVSIEAVRRGAAVDALVTLAAPASWVSFARSPSLGVKRIIEQTGMPLSPETIADPTSWAAEFETVAAENAIASVRIPTLIVHGTADDVVPVDHADRLSARSQRAELKIIEGAGHRLRRDESAVEIVLDWLGRTIG